MSNYRLSLDIGTNSIGWCALALETLNGRQNPDGIVDMGVRIFPDGRNPKDGSSNAVNRRMARAARRNRDRSVERRNRLIAALVTFGLMPEDGNQRRKLTELDPYELRNRGLREKLYLYELGRAIFHLNQRRGFKSNRKSDAKDKEAGAIKSALRDQQNAMLSAGARTFGEYLYLRRQDGESVRSRLKTKRIADAKGKEKNQDYYDFYPGRELLENEFDTLWQVQAEHHPSVLGKEARDKIRDIIFFQRPLKPQVVGKCTFERLEDRLPRVFPIAQRCRIYQELNHLQVLDTRTLKGTPLTLEQRDKLAALLCQPNGKKSGKSEVSFDAMRKKLHLGEESIFSLESEKRKGLEADTTSALLSHKDRFGPRWYQIPVEGQEQIVGALLYEDDEEELISQLMENWEVDRKRAEEIACTPLPVTYGRLGITATRKILAELMQTVIPYSEAVVRAGYASHSQLSSGKQWERLPYYGEVLERHVAPDPEQAGDPRATLEKRFGKVTNPTVHIALNQVRKVVNEIIKLYGPPAEIHVEVLRDLKNSLERKKEITAEQAENQAKNDECARRLRQEFGLPVNRENIQRIRLWTELKAADRVCPYTGETITEHNLFSEEIEIDHVLPWCRTLDDSMANKILCKRRANREKSNQTPFETWGNAGYWPEILARSAVLPKNKRWRFADDAMQRYMKDRDFIARQLTDSQYIARLAREYLAVLFPADEAHKVVCLPGRLTGLFRHHLGLDEILDEINPGRKDSPVPKGQKNRNDHRHHAVDALIIGLMDRAFLQRAASISARLEKEGVYKMLENFPEPWANFHATAREALGKIIVSHKRDHGIAAALHNDTAYGFAKRPDNRGNAVHRVAVKDLEVTNLLAIKGKSLRAELFAHLAGFSLETAFKNLETLDDNKRKGTQALKEAIGLDDKEIAVRIQAFFHDRGIRHVRVIEEIELVPIRNQRGLTYKGFKPDGNAYLEVFKAASGPEWESEIVTSFAANAQGNGNHMTSGDTTEAPRRKVIRLFRQDMIEIEHNGQRHIFYVQKMSKATIALAEHFEANADSRDRDKKDSFNFLRKANAELLRKAAVRFLVVTPAGRVRYLSGERDDSESG